MVGILRPSGTGLTQKPHGNQRSRSRTGDGEVRAALELPAREVSVAEARARVRDHLEAWGLARHDDDLVHTAVLVVSELSTNVVMHTDSPTFGCRLRLTDRALHVAVIDHGSGPYMPTPRTPTDDDESGRGLSLLDMLTESWGVAPGPGGRQVVWATLRPTAT